MKAQSLQVNLTGPCNAHCPFCISKTTWKSGVSNNDKIFKNMSKVFNFAKYHRVDTVMITGTGEPTLVDDFQEIILEAHEFGFPCIEIQTNGQRLWDEPKLLDELIGSGLTGIAVSIASPDPKRSNEIMGVNYDYLDLMNVASKKGLLCRITLNLIEGEIFNWNLKAWADNLVFNGVHQLTLRVIGKPSFNVLDTEASERVCSWIDKNALHDPSKLIEEIETGGIAIRETSFGTRVYDYMGLSTCVATCMQESIDPEEIRSLILQPNGRLYSSWQFPGSILL